jgi:hypothetical protein
LLHLYQYFQTGLDYTFNSFKKLAFWIYLNKPILIGGLIFWIKLILINS